jgi:transposase
MPRKTYNDEFKVAAAKLVRDQGYSIKKAAHSLGVDQGSIRTWVRIYAPALMPLAPDASPEQLHRENLRLREENRRLLMGREILKKATAFFAKEPS